MAYISDYEMDQVILDLGSNANILPKQTWEHMGKPTLQWSPIQLQMANQQKILPMERLQGIIIDIDGASTWMEFEVIEIMDESSVYPIFLGINWTTDMNGVIDLKQRKMILERKSLRVVVPLDPTEGPRYTEPVRSNERDNALDCIYNIVVHRKKEERRPSWDYASSCTTDSDKEDKRWQNRLNGTTTLHFNMMTKSLYCVKAQNHELLMYDGLTEMDEFFVKFESMVLEYHWFDALKWALHVTPTRWWGTHGGIFEHWQSCRCMMQIRFGKLVL